MVRFSITMDDDLTRRVDQECVVRQVSRSDWINEACTRQLRKLSGYGIYPCGNSSPVIDDSPAPHRHNMLIGALAKMGLFSRESAAAAIKEMFSDERNLKAALMAYEELV